MKYHFLYLLSAVFILFGYGAPALKAGSPTGQRRGGGMGRGMRDHGVKGDCPCLQ